MGVVEEEGGGGGGGSRSFAPLDQVLRKEIATKDAAREAQYSVGIEVDTALARKCTGILAGTAQQRDEAGDV